MSIDMALPMWAIFTIRVNEGKLSFFVGFHRNFVSGYIKKRWHTSWKFQLEITNNKKVIAKKPLTSLYEMNSTVSWLNFFVDTTVYIISDSYISNGYNKTQVQEKFIKKMC